MGKVFKSLYGPVLGLIVDGKRGFAQGLFNAANAYFGNPQTVGLALLASVVASLAGSRAPSIEAGKVNVKISDPPRWLNAGRVRSGGGVLFGEFDAQGRFWYLIVHSDEIQQSGESFQYFLDDEAVTVGVDRYVIQKEFRLKTNKAKDPAEVDGQGKGYVRIWTRTYSEADPVPGRVAEFDAAMGSLWTLDHKLVGTTYSVVCIDALDIEHRSKIYRWRGVFGLGEPGVSIVDDWANMYDPRDSTQVLGDRSTYKPSRNAELIWAWFRTHPFGRNKPESSINWERIAEQADICDQSVTGIEGNQKRYEAGVSIVDSKRRADAEKEIMQACDGQIVFDEDGKSWLRVGHWYTPTLSFSRNRDIMAMASVEAQSDDTPMSGVIVEYIEPAAKYTKQPSAAWINPLYYDPLTTPKFLKVTIEACQNHNQAMRLAKGIGMRSQPRHKLAPTVNLRGLRARRERIVQIPYDATFNGAYEIPTPIEMDGAGIFTTFGAVPVSPARWTLLPGEEQPKPVVDGSASTVSFPAITGETVYSSDGMIKIDFPVIARADATYVAEYILTSEITGGENDPWRPMSINVNMAVSGVIPDGNYTVRYRYVTSGGNGPAWEYATIAPATPMPQPNGMSVTSGATQATLSWKNPVDLRFFSVDIWRGTTSTFTAATKIVDNLGGGLGAVQSYTDTPTSAGTYYYWVVATDGAAIESLPAGPVVSEIGAFDFSGATMPSGATLTRASTANRFNVLGNLVNEAVDVARFTYDRISHALQGLLYEPAATNELPNNTMVGATTGVIGSGGAVPTGWTTPTAMGLTREIVGVGQVNGIDYIDVRFYGTTTSTAVLGFALEPAATAAVGSIWTNAAYLALTAGSLANVSNMQLRAGGEAGPTLLNSVLNGTLTRYSNTRTLTSTSPICTLRWNYASVGAAVDFTLRIGLPHRQSGSLLTSSIKTSGSAATRSTDQLSLNWGAKGVPDGSITMRVTFDDGSTQDVTSTVSSGSITLTTPLNRLAIMKIAKI